MHATPAGLAATDTDPGRAAPRYSWVRPGRNFAQLVGACLSIGAVDPRDFVGRNLELGDIAPSEHHEGRIGADEPEHDEPPDVPDQREAGEGREKRRDETD